MIWHAKCFSLQAERPWMREKETENKVELLITSFSGTETFCI